MRRGLWALILLAVTAPSRAAEVTFLSEDGTALRAIHVAPAAGVPRRPAVVALHGCAGLAPPGQPLRLPPREQDWAERLAALGHAVVLPDSFGSRGMGPACGRPDHPAGPKGLRPEDARAALASAAALPGEPPGGGILLGWSQGGSTVLWTLASPPAPGLLRAAIAFYPGCGALLREAPAWAAPVPLLLLLGEADDWTPAHRCQALVARAPAQVELRLFAGAHHGFDHPAAELRTRRLPDGREVTMGTDPRAREGAIAAVTAFLAAQ